MRLESTEKLFFSLIFLVLIIALLAVRAVPEEEGYFGLLFGWDSNQLRGGVFTVGFVHILVLV